MNNKEKLNFAEAREEAEKLKELAGEDASADDYRAAGELIDEENGGKEDVEEAVPGLGGDRKPKAEKFDVDAYRAGVARALREEPDKEKRRAELEEVRQELEYRTARNVTAFRRNLNLKTKEMFAPERLDILIGILGRDKTLQEKEEIIGAAYEDLLFELGAGDGKESLAAVDDFLRRALEKRERMLRGIDQYLAGQKGLPVELRDYQLNALARIGDFIAGGYLRGYVAHPTGVGKTILFNTLVRISGARTLIVVPTRVLANQTIEKLSPFLEGSGEKISCLGSIDERSFNGRAEKGAGGHVVVAVAESLKKNAHDIKAQDFDLVIYDEGHNSYTSRSQDALKYFPAAAKIAFTATPDYYYLDKRPGCEEVELEGVKLYRDKERSAARFYPHEIDNIGMREAINEKMLCPVAGAVIRADEIDLDSCRASGTVNGMDYNAKDLETLLKKHWPTLRQLTLDAYERGIGREGDAPEERVHFRGRQMFAVCALVRQAEDLAGAFNGKFRQEFEAAVAARFKEENKREMSANEAGSGAAFFDELGEKWGIGRKRAAFITGETPPEDRERIFREYSEKKINVLTSVNVLKEGWDAPEAEVCLMLRPTMSRVFYQQAIGRVLRLDDKNPKKKALIVDFLGKYEKMAPITAPAIFGIKEFYNGQMIAEPPKRRPEPGRKTDEDNGEENPYNISPHLEIITIAEGIESIDENIVLRGDQMFVSKEYLTKTMNLRADSFREFRDSETVKLGNKTFFSVNAAREHFLDRAFAHADFDAGALSLTRISQATGFSRGYLKDLAGRHRLSVYKESTSRGFEYDTYDCHDVLRLAVREAERALMKDVLRTPEEKKEYAEKQTEKGDWSKGRFARGTDPGTGWPQWSITRQENGKTVKIIVSADSPQPSSEKAEYYFSVGREEYFPKKNLTVIKALLEEPYPRIDGEEETASGERPGKTVAGEAERAQEIKMPSGLDARSQHIFRTVSGLAKQPSHGGVREALKSVEIEKYIPGLDGLLRKMREKWQGFSKIKSQCERLLNQLEAARKRETGS